MIQEKISIVFFGSGPVAASSLGGLTSKFDVELVVTKSKPTHHKGSWPVEELARSKNLNIGFANTKKEVDTILGSRKLSSQVGLIIDFGVIVSLSSINRFKFGIINSHFSLLPKWRGADPITYTILAGDKQSGVSLMKIVPKLDEGPLIAQEKLSIYKDTNSSSLTDRLIKLSNEMLGVYMPKYVSGMISPIAQPTTNISYSHKIKKSDGIVDWLKDAEIIEREIRAYNDWPRSRTVLGNIDCIITNALFNKKSGTPGEYTIENDQLTIFCGNNSLNILSLQPSGKKSMKIDEFLRGYKDKLL